MFIKVSIGTAFSQVAVANRNPISGKPTLSQFTSPLKDKDSGILYFF